MKEKNKFELSDIAVLFFIFPIILLILDLFNIRIIFFNITDNYDWLGFLGTYISSIITLFLAYTTVKQNKQIEDINKRISVDNIKANTYSEIKFNKIQTIEKKNGEYFLKLNITDKRNKPLNYLIVKNIRLMKFNESKDYLNPYDDPINILLNTDEKIDLEYTPDIEDSKKDFYLARIKVEPKNIELVIKDNNVKLELDLDIINSFNLIESGTYSLIINGIKEGEIFIELNVIHNFSPDRKFLYNVI